MDRVVRLEEEERWETRRRRGVENPSEELIMQIMKITETMAVLMANIFVWSGLERRTWKECEKACRAENCLRKIYPRYGLIMI